MFYIADLPAVRAQLAQDAAAVQRSSTGEPVVGSQEPRPGGMQPEQAPSYPSKSLVLMGGRYHAVSQEK